MYMYMYVYVCVYLDSLRGSVVGQFVLVEGTRVSMLIFILRWGLVGLGAGLLDDRLVGLGTGASGRVVSSTSWTSEAMARHRKHSPASARAHLVRAAFARALLRSSLRVTPCVKSSGRYKLVIECVV